MEDQAKKLPSQEETYDVYKRFNFGAASNLEKLIKLYMTEESSTSHQTFPEFFDSYVEKSNIGFTYDIFTNYLDRNKIKVDFLCEPYIFTRGARRFIFNLFALSYQIGPLIIFPLIAYLNSNWWLLFGILVSYIMSRQVAKFVIKDIKTQEELQGLTFWEVLILLTLSGLWMFIGFSHFIFWPFCILWGWTFYSLAEISQIIFAIGTLKQDIELYMKVIEKKLILIGLK
jgi:hypothetical protein